MYGELTKNCWMYILDILGELYWCKMKINKTFVKLISDCTRDLDTAALARTGRIESLKKYKKYHSAELCDIVETKDLVLVERFMKDMHIERKYTSSNVFFKAIQRSFVDKKFDVVSFIINDILHAQQCICGVAIKMIELIQCNNILYWDITYRENQLMTFKTLCSYIDFDINMRVFLDSYQNFKNCIKMKMLEFHEQAPEYNFVQYIENF